MAELNNHLNDAKITVGSTTKTLSNWLGEVQDWKKAGYQAFPTKAVMDSSLSYQAGTLARVSDDAANNGSYVKLGAYGSGSWTRIADSNRTASKMISPAKSGAVLTAPDIASVFVYDTSLDSDNGAWRFEVSDRSWMNEPLGTADRGIRKEFPRKALVVLRSSVTNATGLSIYDLDDDGMSVWMNFRVATGHMLPSPGTGSAFKAVKALNGMIYIAGGTNGGLIAIDFIGDTGWWNYSFATGNTGVFRGTVADRNLAMGRSGTNPSPLANQHTHDVDVTVLNETQPNQYRCGLPNPTVAVATSGGVTVIHSDGKTVHNTTNIDGGSGYNTVTFLDDTAIACAVGNVNNRVRVFKIPYISVTSFDEAYDGPSAATRIPYGTPSGLAADGQNLYVGYNSGITIINRNLSDETEGLISTITDKYNTGWQSGKSMRLVLSESTADLSNLVETTVLNDGFDYPDIEAFLAADYTGSMDGISIVDGKVRTTVAEGNARRASKALNDLIVGSTYRVDFSYTRPASGGTNGIIGINPVPNSLAQAIGSTTVTSTTSSNITFEATQTQMFLVFGTTNSTVNGQYCDWDNIVVRRTVADRSYSPTPALIKGTLNRFAVASGAEVAAIHGFSSSNYLEIPYTSAFDFGPNDFFAAAWVSMGGSSGQNRTIFDRANSAHTGQRWGLIRNSGDGISFFITDGTTVSNLVSAAAGVNGYAYKFVMGVRRGNRLEIYVDGRLIASTTTTVGTITSSTQDANLRIGIRNNGTEVFTGGIALARVGGYAPSVNQIQYIYETEKALFQPNAKALIGGSSKDVKDIHFDKVDGNLIAATADGVSEFSGLTRVAYYNKSNTPLINTSMKAVSSQSGHRAFVNGSQAVVLKDMMIDAEAVALANEPKINKQVMRVNTTSATPVVVSPRIIVGDKQVVSGMFHVVGRQYGDVMTETAEYYVKFMARRDVANVILVASSTETVTETTSTMDASVVVDTTLQTVGVQVTGKAGVRMVWTVTPLAILAVSNF